MSTPTPSRWLQITILALNATGCALLCVLVVTVSLSETLHRRDPVVNNFLYTWIMMSALTSFDTLATLAGRDIGDSILIEVRESVFISISIVSTLNLSIHLWYIMRSAFHQSSARTKKLRTLGLVITPYICGLVPLYGLHSDDVGNFLFGGLVHIVAILTPAADAVLLFYYWRWYRKTTEAIPGVISFSFFTRLLAFSLYQLPYISLFASSSFFQAYEAFEIFQNLFPLLAFCVVGLHKDILQLWFPCFWKTRRIQEDIIMESLNNAPRAS
ncbi:hypothetical protein JB92DRAFT_2994913 [Gautieria morchelliformis]|nr:hypothetical protein JB92DRAFT_2994913 [Gautieria morchelliformis]